MARACNASALEAEQEDWEFELSLGNLAKPCHQMKGKKGASETQLSRKVLGSIPSSACMHRLTEYESELLQEVLKVAAINSQTFISTVNWCSGNLAQSVH